jgi:two-component system, NarL family, sensor kinase
MLKHAEAKTIEINFNIIDNTLRINISDDGKGFDVSKIKKSSDIGWSNIFTIKIFKYLEHAKVKN